MFIYGFGASVALREKNVKTAPMRNSFREMVTLFISCAELAKLTGFTICRSG